MPADPLSRVFAALADPTRRDMVARLASGDHTVRELAEPYAMSVQAVSKHLRVLRDAGLVQVERDAQRRVYALDPAPFAEIDEWLAPYRRFWSDRLDAIGDRLDAIKESE